MSAQVTPPTGGVVRCVVSPNAARQAPASRNMQEAAVLFARELPKVLSLRFRFRCGPPVVPPLVLAQQWRGAIKRSLERMSPTTIGGLFAPEAAAACRTNPEDYASPRSRHNSNFVTPGFALFVENSISDDASLHSLYLTFFERASDCVPVVLQAIMMQQAVGLGERRLAFEMMQVEAFRPGLGWTSSPSLLSAADAAQWLCAAHCASSPASAERDGATGLLAISLRSRTVLTRDGRSLTAIKDWPDIGDAAIRRATQIRSVWLPAAAAGANAAEWEAACLCLQSSASRLRLLDSSVVVDRGQLSSGRQRTRYASAGVIGTTVWQAPPEVIAAWLPLLRFVESAQLGQQTTVGMGRVAVLVRSATP